MPGTLEGLPVHWWTIGRSEDCAAQG